MTHEVYIGRYNEEVVYVGEGRKGRHVHLNSGVSNVYQANSVHFMGGDVDIEVIPMASKEAAVELEANLINKYQPKWNKHGTVHHEKRLLLQKYFAGFVHRTKPWWKQPPEVRVMKVVSHIIEANDECYISEELIREHTGGPTGEMMTLKGIHFHQRLPHLTVTKTNADGTRVTGRQFRVILDPDVIYTREYWNYLNDKIR